MSATIRLVPYLRVRNNLRRLAADRPDIGAPITQAWAYESKDYLRDLAYPAPTGGGYIRTYLLPTGWIVNKVSTGVFEILNIVDYSVYVIKEFSQAAVHKGRWWVAEQELDKRLPVLRDNMRVAYVKEWTA